MMKKICTMVSLLLCLCLILGTFTGCNKAQNDQPTDNQNKTDPTETMEINGGGQAMILGTWIWEDGEYNGTFTFTSDWVEYSYSASAVGVGTCPYTMTENGVTIESSVEEMGDGVFTFQDNNTLVATNGFTLVRDDGSSANGGGNGGSQEPVSGGQEGMMLGTWEYSEDLGTTTFTFDGRDRVEKNGYEGIVYYSYSYDGQTLLIYDGDETVLEGYLDDVGDLIFYGMDGYFTWVQEGGTFELDGTCWDNDTMEISLYFDGETFTMGSEAEGGLLGYYFLEGDTIYLETEEGAWELYLGGQGELYMDGGEGYFYQVDAPGYLNQAHGGN